MIYYFFSLSLLAKDVPYTAPSEFPDLFQCTFNGCDWSRYVEGKDWGYYFKRDGNCKSCMEKCLNDQNCGSLECQDNSVNQTNGYCTWWKKNQCVLLSEFIVAGNGLAKTCKYKG